MIMEDNIKSMIMAKTLEKINAHFIENNNMSREEAMKIQKDAFIEIKNKFCFGVSG